MNAVTYIDPRLDRTEWGPGPWDGEPDKISWTDEATGLPCVMVRNKMGSWCGYVAVEPGHSAHGKDYVDVDVDVHGGLTFCDSCNETGPIEHSVCHVPEPGKSGDVWWLGFDCGHAWDVQPGLDATLRSFGLVPPHEKFPGVGPGTTYRDVKYVRRECEQLAAQLIKLGGAGP
jgi:hypothetical protein